MAPSAPGRIVSSRQKFGSTWHNKIDQSKNIGELERRLKKIFFIRSNETDAVVAPFRTAAKLGGPSVIIFGTSSHPTISYA
jgi:hypothetical protein